jgi:predicted amidohydrolase YtcJ
MKTLPLRAVLRMLPLLLCAASISHAQGRIVEPADIIVIHGRVYTENPQLPWAQAIAMYRGKIVAVGDNPVIERPGFVPEQRLTVAQVIESYTPGAAFASRREKYEGSLEVGKLADLIILSQNIFDVEPHKIGATKVVTTIVGGRLVFQADTK